MEIIGKVVRLGALTEGTSARGPWRNKTSSSRRRTISPTSA
jgi:hypothetical protein